MPIFADDTFKNALYDLMVQQGERLGTVRALNEALEVVATFSEWEVVEMLVDPDLAAGILPNSSNQEPKETLINTIKDGSWRSLEPRELRRLKYAARYFGPQENELEKAELTWDTFVAGKAEILAAIAALPPQAKHPDRVPFVCCNGCGELVSPDALADASLMPAVCPACYASYEEGKPRWPANGR